MLKPINWWFQFPLALRQVAKVRFLASLGAGGVVYMTPLIFHQADLSASEIGQGLAASAIIGSVSRLLCGLFLDRGLACSWPICLAGVLSIFANFVLVHAVGFANYLGGQLLIGMAAGFYFPAIELSVSLSCSNFPPRRGYALARSADALGIAMGTFAGVIASSLSIIRAVYIIEVITASITILILSRRPLTDKRVAIAQLQAGNNSKDKRFSTRPSQNWLLPLLPIFALTIVVTATITLRQSALPLDLVHGSLERPPLSVTWSGALVALQLSILVLLQWPVGSWVAQRNLHFGLGIGLAGLGIGSMLIALSGLHFRGLVLILVAELLLAFGEAAFLPTATDAIIREAPIELQGLAMALFSQCFAISASTVPLFAGVLLDTQGNGLLLWLSAAAICILMLPMLGSIRSSTTLLPIPD